MPKIKTRKAWAKRFKLSKKGKVKRRRAGLGHLLAKKSRKKKRRMKRPGLVCSSDSKTLKMFLLPAKR